MGSRIATLQRQARELGRLRTGMFVKPSGAKGRPVRSKTWILTSPSDTYIEAAAAQWGGTPEKWQPQGNGAQQYRVITEAVAIDAILPPGDPLSQSFEMWNRGGAARRCDGYTELLSDSPCLCVAEWGTDFHTAANKDDVCKMTTRLNVLLPDMPDIGVWRVETHSYYSANEIAAAVDMIRSAAGDRLVPLTLRIEQRTRVSGGQTKHFPVVAVELRGATAGQILAAAAGEVALTSGGGARAAIGPARPDYVAQAKAAESREEFLAVVDAAEAAGHMDEALKDQLGEIWAANTAPKPEPDAPAATPQPTATAAPDVVDVDPDDIHEGETSNGEDVERAYALVLENCPDGWDMTRLNAEFAARNGGTTLNTGTATELRAFLGWLKGGAK